MIFAIGFLARTLHMRSQKGHVLKSGLCEDCELNGTKSRSMPGLSGLEVSVVERFRRTVGAILGDVDLFLGHPAMLSAQLSTSGVYSLSRTSIDL